MPFGVTITCLIAQFAVVNIHRFSHDFILLEVAGLGLGMWHPRNVCVWVTSAIAILRVDARWVIYDIHKSVSRCGHSMLK